MKLAIRSLAAVAAIGIAHAAGHSVTQKDREFSTSTLVIKPGDSITFKNDDSVVHNVYSESPGLAFDLRRQAPGGTSTVPFAQEGVCEVRCSIHPKMKLKVIVKK